MMPDTFEITFRPLEDEDLPLLYRWLNDPAVILWWEGRDVSRDAVVRDYGSDHKSAVEHWMALIDGEPLGWIQCYCAKHAEDGETYHWADHVDLEQTGGIDYLVGNAARRGQGVGSTMIRAFVTDIVFARHPAWQFAAAGPFEANIPSWKALEKAGFRRRATLNDDDGACVLMVIERAS
jgi:RimJ/RimL family protein N-acetyltransferase